MKLTVYSYDFEYKVENGQVFVYSYCKQPNGSKIVVKHQHPVFFYASLENVDVNEFKRRLDQLTIGQIPWPAKVLNYEEAALELKGQIKPFLKIYANYPKAVPLLAKEIQNWGIECLEKDILFIHRYLRDAGIIPMTQITVEGTLDPDTNILMAAAVEPSELKPSELKSRKDWKILALDIETYSKHREIDFQNNPILMGGVYGANFAKVITWKKFDTADREIEFAASEKELLERTAEYIRQFSPEILAGYFSDGFDLPYIHARCIINKVNFSIGDSFSIGNSGLIVRKSSASRSTEVKIIGIAHLDLFKFIKQIFGLDLKVESFNLDAIAEKLLGLKKQSVNLDKLFYSWDHSPVDLEQFCRYNLHDARLTYLLTEKLLPEMIEFGIITGLPLFDVTRMRFSRLVESYILKRAISRKVIAPNRPGDQEISERMNESIQGAFVYEPKPGLYRDLAVFDFRSLYPSIIASHNLGPESLYCSCCKNKTIPDQPYWFCQKNKAFLPSLLAELINRRIEIKKQIKEASGQDKTVLEAQSYALKILANSFYGYLGFYGARWYSLESAASTTAYARYYIKDTIKKAEESGFKVCYSDTDSCFLLLGGKSVTDALQFKDSINQSLPGNMELNFEGYFPRGLFVAAKNQDKGAKKKYALLKEDGSFKITGFETVRRNWSLLAKEVQREVLRFILQDQTDKALAYVRGAVKDLKKGIMPLEKLIIKTQITREISQYKVVGPHIFVAHKMIAKGQSVSPGMVVKYIIGKGSGLVRERARLPSEIKEGDYDYNYYISHQLIPAVSSIFLVLGYSEEDIFKESSQKGLSQFH